VMGLECLKAEIWVFSSPVSLVTLLSSEMLSGVCLKSQNTVQSVAAARSFEMTEAIIFLPHFGFHLVMKTLVPSGDVRRASLLPGTALICLSFCVCFPPTSFSLKFPFPPFHVTAGVSLCPALLGGKATVSQQKPAPRCRHPNVTTAWAAATGVCSRSSGSAGWRSAFS